MLNNNYNNSFLELEQKRNNKITEDKIFKEKKEEIFNDIIYKSHISHNSQNNNEAKDYLRVLENFSSSQRSNHISKFIKFYKEAIDNDDFKNYAAFVNCIVIYSDYLIDEEFKNGNNSQTIYRTDTPKQIDLKKQIKTVIDFLLKKYEVKMVFKQIFSLYKENLLHAEIIELFRKNVMDKCHEITRNNCETKYNIVKEYNDFFDLVYANEELKNYCNDRRIECNDLYNCILDEIKGEDFTSEDVIEFLKLDKKLREKIEGLLNKYASIDSNYNCYVFNIINQFVNDNILKRFSFDSTLLNKFKEDFIVNIKVDYFNSQAFNDLVKTLNNYNQSRKIVLKLKNSLPFDKDDQVTEQWFRDFNNTDSTISYEWSFENRLQSITINFIKNDMNVKIKNNVALLKKNNSNNWNSNSNVININESDKFTIKNYPAFFDSELEAVDGIKRNFVF